MTPGGAGDWLFLLVGFEREFWDAGDTPVDFAPGRFEFAVLAAFDLAVGLRVGFDLIGDDLFDDYAFDPAGEELVFGAAGALNLFSFCAFVLLQFGCFGAGGFGLSQRCFVKIEVMLGGIVALGFGPVELLPVVFVELKSGGELTGDFLKSGLEFLDPFEEGLGIK